MTKPLKIAINIKPDESAGGGVQNANSLDAILSKRGHRVVRYLEPDIDVILLASFRNRSSVASFFLDDARQYLYFHPSTACVLRLGDSDEARYSRQIGIAEAAMAARAIADHTVFVSHFLQTLYFEKYFGQSDAVSVIHSAASSLRFHPDGRAPWDGSEPLNIVTHHWSPAFTKGFDFYERLDLLLAKNEWRNNFRFTVIGALPYGFTLRNTSHVSMLSQDRIGSELKKHHVYLTGARGEAAGMHLIEALHCGLPALYVDSGSHAEYCQSRGLAFDAANFENKLLEMRARYNEICATAPPMTYSIEDMALLYEALFQRLAREKRALAQLAPGPLRKLRYVARSKLRALRHLYKCVKTESQYVLR